MADTVSKRNAISIRNSLSEGLRRYVYTKEAIETYDKNYNYLNEDVRLLRFAEDTLGAQSDCFILYAISMMGIADIDGVRLFLGALANKNKDLYIADMSDTDTVRTRIKTLYENGFLLKHTYQVYVEDTPGFEGKLNNISLYTPLKFANSFMNQRLEKHVVYDEWFCAKPLYELVGFTSAAFAAGKVAQTKGFIEQKQGVFKTAAIGVCFISCVLKMKTDKDHTAYVGFIPSFLHRDRSIMTDDDYDDVAYRRVNMIKQYLYFRDQKRQLARAVVVVEDNADLVEIGRWILQNGSLYDDLDRVYFTGEGALRNVKSDSVKKKFLRLVKPRKKGDVEVDFEAAIPDFIL